VSLPDGAALAKGPAVSDAQIKENITRYSPACYKDDVTKEMIKARWRHAYRAYMPCCLTFVKKRCAMIVPIRYSE